MARRLTRAQAETLYEKLASVREDPRTELDYTNAYTLLVAVALSAQATDKGVNKATKDLFETPAAMVALGLDGLSDYIRTIGLWRNKAKNVIALSEKLIAEHGGDVPHDRAALESLPGVGRKTANVVLSEAFGEETIAVDTHVFRVANRTGLAPGRNPDEVEAGLMNITPKRFMRGAHHWLILHGRYVCIARRPECPRCVIRDICLYKEKTSTIAPTKTSAASGAKAKKR
jgi:endonuclease-3